ncbi:MAG: hypothetical protein AAGA87_06015 [Pseudomonadota bacterium]
MAILKNLEALRLGHPGIEAIAYVDLGSETVLGKTSAINEPQEEFDALSATASEIIGGATGEADEAVRLQATKSLIIRRAPLAPSEAVCVVCAPDIDVLSVLNHVTVALEANA